MGMEELPEEAGKKVQSCKDFTAHSVRVCVNGVSVVVSVIRCSFCTRCSDNKEKSGEAVWCKSRPPWCSHTSAVALQDDCGGV
ncbi:MAG: hypothetical protein J6R36_03110 [Bacteroidaceae bacterium]|nr:hypothetical protein [Bacteroidaceae bacterium]